MPTWSTPRGPLCPFLFILAIEGLTRIIRRATYLGVFNGIRVGGTGPMLSHFMYADDVVFCGEWSKGNSNALNLRRLLRGFYLISGLRISSRKIRFYGVGVNDNEIAEMASDLRVASGHFPFTHLGVPIASNMNLVRSWDPVLEKVRKRLFSWKSKCLSYGGRITLLKSVLSSLPLYYFSLFRALVQVINNLEKLRRNFFWGGTVEVDKMSWLAWDKVVAPVEYGGIGLGSLRDANLSLLSKWWWRFKTSCDSLWRKVVWSIHGSGRGWTNIPVKISIGSAWKQIASVPSLLPFGSDKAIKANLRNGSTIFFWYDWWLSDDVLHKKFPLLFALEKNKACLVSDRLPSSSQHSNFNGAWRRLDFSNEEQYELDNLMLLLIGVTTSFGIDTWSWTVGSSNDSQ
ncbi:uncharacterized protein LOC110899019 [Helianthus annuus]|uniref:uncharacterized protein LOC110899019 n=1 Tax=Helianthus annuus TaxID=4232 RepID=UPI000B905DC1|nr:uncharacterized protein LOC110899019 [Helianthus annuus]